MLNKRIRDLDVDKAKSPSELSQRSASKKIAQNVPANIGWEPTYDLFENQQSNLRNKYLKEGEVTISEKELMKRI